jgi:hypothetical protein
MNPTIAQMLVQDHQHELAVEAAREHLAATRKAANRTSRTGASTGTRTWIAALVSSLVAVVR